MPAPFDTERSFQLFSRFLIAPARNLHIVPLWMASASSRLWLQIWKANSPLSQSSKKALYAMEDRRGGTMLCAVASDMTAQLRSTLWNQERPAILTSGTLAVGRDFL